MSNILQEMCECDVQNFLTSIMHLQFQDWKETVELEEWYWDVGKYQVIALFKLDDKHWVDWTLTDVFIPNRHSWKVSRQHLKRLPNPMKRTKDRFCGK